MPNEQQPAASEAEILSKATEQLIETQPASDQVLNANESDDDREYREAHEALKVEATKPDDAPKADTEIPKEGELPTPKAKESPPPAADDKAASIMIPKARLDEVLRQREEATNNAAYLQGVVETQKQMLKGISKTDATGTDQAPAVKPIAERLAEISAAKLALAAQYDEGTLTLTDLRKQEIALDDQADAIRTEKLRFDEQRIREEAKADARQEAMAERLETHSTELDTKHPSLLEIKSDHHWAFLRQEAERTLKDQGVNLVPNEARSLMLFRERMAELADQYVPIWTGKPAPAPKADIGTSPAQQPTVANQKPPIAQQRLKKIELAHQQPPETGVMGTSGTRTELTDTQVEGMSDDDLANLPAATRARITGRAA